MATKTGSAGPSTGSTKERLSREAVARAAMELADTEGIEALTVRRLATTLGVTPMALYWHFKDKDALLDGVVEALMADVRAPAHDGSAPWDERLRAELAALLEGLAAHPAVASLVKTRMLISDPGRDVAERVLALLREGGFSAERTSQLATYALLTMTSIVADMPGLSIGASEEEREQQVRRKWAALQALSPKRYPHIIESAATLTDCVASDQWLDFGLDTIMAGFRGQAPSA
ncbi:TetR family transcriptional regulator [Nocardioides lijunqiniae]|uniref:TetR family transcriptional regulator n=1 Tax=Nocardioides lijunqiniae TaxID=2760832 RepID=UPI001877573D|nr:TetR family transcriptional regulator [Nocardioides lijunqiniae]